MERETGIMEQNFWTGVSPEAEAAMVRLLKNLNGTLVSPLAIGGGGLNIIFDRPSPNGKVIYRTSMQIRGDGSLGFVSETHGEHRQNYEPGGSMFSYFQAKLSPRDEE